MQLAANSTAIRKCCSKGQGLHTRLILVMTNIPHKLREGTAKTNTEKEQRCIESFVGGWRQREARVGGERGKGTWEVEVNCCITPFRGNVGCRGIIHYYTLTIISVPSPLITSLVRYLLH